MGVMTKRKKKKKNNNNTGAQFIFKGFYIKNK